MSHNLRSIHKASNDDHHLEERKTPLRNKEPADYMLSQDSIKAFALEADKETYEEREKLQSMERQRREFAKKLRDTQDQEFKAK